MPVYPRDNETYIPIEERKKNIFEDTVNYLTSLKHSRNIVWSAVFPEIDNVTT